MNEGIWRLSAPWVGRASGVATRRDTYYPVELGSLVALRPALGLVLACAELPEVLGCSGHHILEEFKRYPAERFTWMMAC